MAESSCFRKIIDPVKQRATSILVDVFETACKIAFILLAIICPSVFQLVDNDVTDDVADLLFGLSAIFHMFLDALFLYVPLINEETKCVMLDNRLKIAAIVLRSLGDLRYVLRIIYRIKRGLREYRRQQVSHSLTHGLQNNDKEMTSRGDGRQNFPSPKKIAMSIASDTVCILPVPQVVISVFLPKMRGLRSLKIIKFLNFLILLQYLPRLYPIFKMCMQVNKEMLDFLKKKTNDAPKDVPKWFGIAINFAGYILASHVLGAFWYFFSIQREIDCWGYACRIENGCEFSTSCVENTLRNITHIKNLCPINPPNATVFDFGIYLYALQSGMQGSTNYQNKFLQCLSWGLRNLSSFASNLNSSTYGWENLFVVVISISGLVLFIYLLGHSQTYMQETDRRENIKRKMKMIIEPKMHSLLSEYGLPNHMKWRIKRAVEIILEKDEDFIVENMFSILSFNFPDERQRYIEDLDFDIKRELFLYKLMKVDGLKHKDKEVRENICRRLEPMIYKEESYIIREGEPLDKMFFVTWGNVLTYKTIIGGASCSSAPIQVNEKSKDTWYGKEKDRWYGQELLAWAEQPSSELSTLPISPITVKSHKKVEVFALKAVDLQNVVSKFPGHFNTGHKEIAIAS